MAAVEKQGVARRGGTAILGLFLPGVEPLMEFDATWDGRPVVESIYPAEAWEQIPREHRPEGWCSACGSWVKVVRERRRPT